MGRIGTLTTLRVEDFESEQRKWLPRLFQPLNQFLTSVTNVINGRIEFVGNIPAIDRALSFVYVGTPQRFPWTVTTLTPSILWVGQAFEGTVAISVSPIWTYDQSSGVLSVDFLKPTGASLTVGLNYKIFIRVVS